MPPKPSYGRSVPKLVGADFELGNFILGLNRSEGTGAEASTALLRQVDGVPASSRANDSGYAYGWPGWTGYPTYDAQDHDRKFLDTNGGSAYIDLQHAEFCIPEVLCAFDHAAATAAMFRIAREAQIRANAELPDGQRLQVLVCNSDGRSNSFGSHLNFLISRSTWEDIVERRLHYMQFLACHQLSSMIFTGQGKVGSENHRPRVDYQLSQRADFFETVTGPQTTYRRPIINSRNETLCGPSRELARLHVIAFDNTLCHGANVLKVGSMQLVLAMLEAEEVDPRIAIDDLVGAATVWSHDPSLTARVRLVDGGRATALEIQERILERALRHRDTRGFETVARADEILALWEDTLAKLAVGDFASLCGRLDWVLKRQLLERALAQRPDLDWQSPELKYLDQIFGSLDPEEGLVWPHMRSGLVEHWVSEDEIEYFLHEPPKDTRAWTRAMVLRTFPRDDIESVDWDHIAIRTHERGVHTTRELRLDDPLDFTCQATQSLFERNERTGDFHENP